MSWEGVSIACRKPEKRKIGVTWDYVAFVSAYFVQRHRYHSIVSLWLGRAKARVTRNLPQR